MKKERIWELDALRGLCIIGMIVVHLFFDLAAFGGMELELPDWFVFMQEYGHVLFILISGICVTFTSHSVKRGTVVFAGGLLISYVTLFMEHILGFTRLGIWFGILHLLGLCMVLYPLFKKLPHWALALLGAAMVLLGFYLKTLRVDVEFLFPLGLHSGRIYTGSDYFPIFPCMGWFFLGAAFGKSLYRKKTTLFPKVNAAAPVLRGLSFCGRHSLEIYLLHQPVLVVAVLLFYR